MLEPYYLKIQAVRITRENYLELKELAAEDDVLQEGCFEDYENDWFVGGPRGYEIMPGTTVLIPR